MRMRMSSFLLEGTKDKTAWDKTDRKIQKHEQVVLDEDLTLGESLVQEVRPASVSVIQLLSTESFKKADTGLGRGYMRST